MGIFLYLLAMLLDAVPIIVRYLIGAQLWGPGAGLALALGPLAWSLLTLLGLPSGGTLTRWELGARHLSLREQREVDGALHSLLRPGMVVPKAIYVLDLPTQNAGVVGTTLYLDRELIWSPDLPAVLAHELGHLNSMDGRLTHAVRRLVFPGASFVAEWLLIAGVAMGGCGPILLSAFLFLLGGGFGAWVLGPAWTAYWRGREYKADAYAAELGMAQPLLDSLHRWVVLDYPNPWLWGRTHPYTESRIDRLERLAVGEAPPKRDWSVPTETAMWSGLAVLVAVPLLACVLGSIFLGPPLWRAITRERNWSMPTPIVQPILERER